MMCRSEQIGLCLTSLSKASLAKIIPDSGSMVGTPLKVTLDRPEDRIRCPSGKACSRVACSLWILLKETEPVNVRMKFGEAATHCPDRRISVELAKWSPAQICCMILVGSRWVMVFVGLAVGSCIIISVCNV